MSTLTPVDIRNFKGINLRENPNVIEDDELAECINFDIGRAGELVKRQGVSRLHFGEDLGSNAVTLLGHFKTDSVSYIMAVAGGAVWYSPDGEIWTQLILANAEFGVQYTNKYYILRTDGLMIEWDPSGTSELLLLNERDFEIDTVQGWELVSGISAFVSDSNKAFTGNRSLHVTATTATAKWTSRLFTATPNYNITASINTNASAVKTVRLQIQWFNSSMSSIGTTNQDLSSTVGSWTLHTVASSAPANTAFVRVNVEFQSATSGDNINMDNATIKLAAGIPRLVDGSPKGTAALVFKDRLFVVNSQGIGSVNSRLYFSEPGDFGDWPSINFIDVRPGEGDFLTSVAVIQDILIIFKTESIWALYIQGAPENWNLRIMSPEIGCVSKYTPKEIEGFLYFVGRRGVYRTDGNVFEDISESLNPIFADRVTNLSTANKDSASWWEDRYLLLFYPTPTTVRYFIFHLRKGGWTEWTFPSGTSPASFLEVTTSVPQKGLYAGSSNTDGKIFRFGDDVYLDEGQTFACSLRTKDFTFSSPATLKRVAWLVAEHKGEGNITINNYAQLTFRNSDDVQGGAGVLATKLKGPGFVRSWQAEVVHAEAFPFTFYGITAMVYPKRTIVNSGV